ncbi:MAG: ABC transporter substrate-binding protein [Desulfosarcinaceae bacterium]|nr:ABC transporter substrate-binding protein [Desulfosarcinaceae bacterium]
MPFRMLWSRLPLLWRLFGFALAWLLLISALHWRLNTERPQRQVIRLGYMPVVTNLAAPLLDHVTREGDGIQFKAIKFASFAEMAEALRNDDIQAAFMIAPLAVVLRQQGVDVRVVYIGNRHESTLVAQKGLAVNGLADLVGKTVAVPMRFSGHNLCLLREMAEAGLENQINIVEMNPPDMAAALSSGALDAYYVGEPFAAQTLMSGDARLVHYVESVWPGFICNLMLVKGRLIDEHPQQVQQLVSGAVRSGLWAKRHPQTVSRVLSRYWHQDPELIRYAMNTPENRIVFNQYTPIEEELQYIGNLMHRFGLTAAADIEGLVADRFALQVPLGEVASLDAILP